LGTPASPSLAGAPLPTHEAAHGSGDAGSAGGGYLNEVRSISASPRQGTDTY